MSQWFRMYSEVLNDPKAQRLSGDDFKGWVNVLCLASQGDGIIPADDDIAFALRIDLRKARKLLETLASSGLIDVTETGRTPHNWNNRQYKSDVSTDRVKRFRNAKRNVSETATETPPDTDTDTEQSIPLSNDNGRTADSVDPDREFWNSAKAYLTRCGIKNPGAMVGKWCGEYTQPETAKALTQAQLERAVEPIQFIQGYFRKRRLEQTSADELPIC